MIGTVLDIQRFSLHDGPGIRTTVFLKGCPLRCSWCHNPESWDKEPQLMFQREKCVNCRKCEESCLERVHSWQEGTHILDFSKCVSDGACVSACTVGALRIAGKKMEIEEVMKEVEADCVYYKNSGGGMTISGGEPLVQMKFLHELLKKAKGKGIHTCVETNGYEKQEKYEQILDETDLFLFDVKLMNDEKHKKYTGVSNERIFQNLNFLYASGTDIIIRCPIIPGVNDDDEHIMGIVKLTQKYPSLAGIEILPYHDMGKGKWQSIGKEYQFSKLETMKQQQREQLLGRFHKAGCQKAVLG